MDGLVSGTYWGQIAINHLRERINITQVVLSIPAIVIATILVGIPLNWLLGGTRSGLQRIAIALVSVPATVVLAVALFTFNALVPETYASLLRFADWIWQASLSALSSRGNLCSRSNQASEYRKTRLLRSSLCDHGFVQCCGLVSRQRCVRIATKPGETKTRRSWPSLGKIP